MALPRLAPLPRHWAATIPALMMSLVFAACSSGGESGTPSPTAGPTESFDKVSEEPSGLPDKRVNIVIHAVGDTLAQPGVIEVPDAFGTVGDELTRRFSADDLTLANLECAAAESGEPVNPDVFSIRCRPQGLDDLIAAGVDAISIANDHIDDFGPDALAETIAEATERGLIVVGPGPEPVVVDTEGGTIALVALNRSNEDATPRAEMFAAVEAASTQADHVVVSIHWGTEDVRSPLATDERLGAELIEAGATAVFGHGAHRVQSLIARDQRPVFHNLGHFIWPVDDDPVDRDSAVGYLAIDDAGDLTYCLLPVTLDEPGQPTLDRPDRICELNA